MRIEISQKQQAILSNLVNARENAQAALDLALACMVASADVPEGAQVAGLEDGALIMNVPGSESGPEPFRVRLDDSEDEDGDAGPA
jgi:hypothetical protein